MLVFVIGTRPQYIKSSILINQLIKSKIPIKVIDTCQHYDRNMSNVFLEELKFPNITKLHSGVGPTHGIQTANIIRALEPYLIRFKPKMAMVVGDTNSTLSAAITIAKLNIPMAHLEAGLRSYDRTVPEEVNRVVTDLLSSLLFCSSKRCINNLKVENTLGEVHWSGDTMFDVLLKQLKIAKKQPTLSRFNIGGDYIFATVHHHFNTDNKYRLRNILKALSSAYINVVLSLHPRTKKMINRFNIKTFNNIQYFAPFGYHDTINLMNNAEIIVTDSGGMQKEAFWLRKPCVTLKEDTVWIETVNMGANTLTNPTKMKSIIRTINNCPSFPKRIRNVYGSGHATKYIVRVLKKWLKK